MDYIITATDGRTFTLVANSYEEAALKATVVLHGRYSPRLVAQRTTGDHGLSGYFAAYQRVGQGTLSHLDPEYHVGTTPRYTGLGVSA